MAEFFSTWFSYFVILTIVLIIWSSLFFKTIRPDIVIGLHRYMGCVGPLAVIIISFVLALISKFDPLGWLWADIGNWFTRTIAEDRDIL